MTGNPEQRRTGRWILLGLIALFVAPLLLASAWYAYAPQYTPPSVTHGQLIDPAQRLEPFRLVADDGAAVTDEGLQGRWHLVQIVAPSCAADCRQRLHATRQIERALGKDRKRLGRWLVVPTDGTLEDAARLQEKHPQLRFLHAESGAGFTSQFPPDHGSVDVFLIDPLGNLMMRFGPSANPDRMLDDIEKLLKLSRIG